MSHKYDASLANKIEQKWQKYWDEHGTFISKDYVVGKEPFVVMDMFPYPSGAGLHVGHPLGYIATDVTARFWRMNNKNVLHALGYDAFGLPAEQYAIKTGQHPRKTTEENIQNMRKQLKMLGLAHDPTRTFATIDPGYVKWTQWIFKQIYNSYFDEELQKARPISELLEKHPEWKELPKKELADILNEFRLAYISYSPVNWCPGLGTVLANEEVTAEGKSERGNFPVFKRNLKQWSMRITKFADRLDDDLEMIDWPEKVKMMQHNWIGKSQGAFIEFDVDGGHKLKVFTTRPDTIRGATFAVIAPEHPLLEFATEDVTQYVEVAKSKSAIERQQDAGKKTGEFTGLFAVNPITKRKLPIYVADYVLMGYGTGAIMAVPADDKRDEEFATIYNIPIEWDYQKYSTVEDAISELEKIGCGEGTTTFRLRDWLFSRQRYWGEPFPIVYDEDGVAFVLDDSMLPVALPEVPDFAPKSFDPTDADSEPEPPLGRNDAWKVVELPVDKNGTLIAEGSQEAVGQKTFTRETNTMPNWAGSCWYYLRYLNASWGDEMPGCVAPENAEHQPNAVVDKSLEEYWLGPEHNSTVGASGGVDLYVGGVEHAVLHLLYARFWHKVLRDLGYVSSLEPFHKLFNQGYVQAFAYTDSRGVYVPANDVTEQDGKFFYKGQEVSQEYGKMGKSLLNVVTPDDMAKQFGADTFRIYEMSMGPLDLSRPWETRAVIGAQRYLQRVWRLMIDEESGELNVSDKSADEETKRFLNKSIAAVKAEMSSMRPNTAISKLIELVNFLTQWKQKNGMVPAEVAEVVVKMTAPLAPHISEELWSKLGHTDSIICVDFPSVDEAYLVDDVISIGVQVNGKVRDTLTISPSATQEQFEQEAKKLPNVAVHLEGKQILKSIVVPGRIVNFVVK
ncbi:MAG: leucine--tRNA ligase [Candidatus Ancillula sp.]|jgi:leucyl-tRNA synthetase|nr:leucine--tRNA ligase [Candidatus Ancillula sp.]